MALYIVLSHWYKQGNSGLPTPTVIAGPSYLYGVLALTSDYLEGLPIVLAAGLTAGLYWRTNAQPKTAAPGSAPSGTGRPAIVNGVQSRQVNPQTKTLTK